MSEANFIKEAKNFLNEAKLEFNRGAKEDNKVLMRDACEKAWNAVVLATNYLVVRRKMPLPKSFRERKLRLGELESMDQEIKKRALMDRFAARFYNLHEQAFYVGYFDPLEIETEFTKVEEYIKEIEAIANGKGCA